MYPTASKERVKIDLKSSPPALFEQLKKRTEAVIFTSLRR